MRILLTGFGLTLLVALSSAQSFTYQGFLRQDGTPANGTFDFRFRLFTAPTGGTQVGSDQLVNDLSVQNGLFTVSLDFGAVWTGADRYLEIQVGSTTLSPRVKVTATPYAMYALKPWEPNGSALFYNGGNVGIGTSSPWAKLSFGGDIANTKLALWQGNTASEMMGLGIGHAQFRLHLNRPEDRFSFLNAPNGNEVVTIKGNGNVGIGTSSPSYQLHVVTRTADRAIYGHHPATTGVNVGGWFESASTSGTGVFGWATATTGVNVGGWFESASTSGTGVYGNAAYGVFGESAMLSGFGVLGKATITSGPGIGVFGQSASMSGAGVLGEATATTGVTFGVYGRSNSSSGYGVYSLGNFAATGTKSFQIDHPLDPENTYLNHFCTEAPEPLNAYSGNVVTDAQGYAVVQLPPYFETINRDFRYQLTCMGQFAQAIGLRKYETIAL